MKIEMGESLMCSWLKHAKECKIVQLNWKPSDCWKTYNENDAVKLLNIIEQHFPVFKNSKYEQLMKQAEIDVLGLSTGDDSCDELYYAIDVAYHENGLNYGSKNETIERISKKLLRSALILYTYFNTKQGEIIFASPKINPAIYCDLREQIDNIDKFMKDLGFLYNFKLIANQDFSQSVLNPIVEISGNVSDTSELFMRAFQLSNLCKTTDNIYKKVSKKKFKSTYNEFKIGATVRNKLNFLFQHQYLSQEDINNLFDKDYCKKIFNLKYPLLISRNQNRYDDGVRGRYWSVLFDDKYYACNDWYEPQRADFEAWYNSIIEKVSV